MYVIRKIYLYLSLLIFVGFTAGCSNPNSPNDNLSSNLSASIDNAFSTADENLQIMKDGGVNVDSSMGVFSISWDRVYPPNSSTPKTLGSAIAVGFDKNTPDRPPLGKGGIDLGTVYFSYGGNKIELVKHTGPDGGVVYTPDRSGQNPSDGGIQFNPGQTYSFQVSGSSGFSGINIDLTAPQSLLQITAPSSNGTVNASGDLTISWSDGGNGSGVLVCVAPFKGPQNGNGHRPGPGMNGNNPPPPSGQDNGIGRPPQPGAPFMNPDAIVKKLDNDPGQITIPASDLEAMINKTGAKQIVCSVSEVYVNKIAHDGGNINAVVHNSDQIILSVK